MLLERAWSLALIVLDVSRMLLDEYVHVPRVHRASVNRKFLFFFPFFFRYDEAHLQCVDN